MNAERRVRGKEAVRARLITATAELLESAPPPAVSAKEIAEHAGVNHGQIHHYFGSKDDLVAIAVQHAADARWAEFRLDGEGASLPIEAERPRGWRSLAYLALAGVWRRPSLIPSPAIGAMVERRADVRGERTDSVDVLSEVVASLALQRGWWFFSDMIESSLETFKVKKRRLHRSVAQRSISLVESDALALIDGQIDVPVASPLQPSIGEHDPDDVAERLLDAALALLSDQAPDNVSSKQIAAHAGVNHGQIHHYFGGKDRVVALALHRHAMQQTAVAMDEETPRPLPIEAEERSPFWRSMLHLAVMDKATSVVLQPSPVVCRMVEVFAAQTGKPTTDDEVHSQVAAVHALQLGWDAYRDVIEFSIKPFRSDLAPVRARLGQISVRLLDGDVAARWAI